MIGAGGGTVDEAVQRTMEKLVTDEIAVRYSFQGASTKKRFASFKNICKSLKGECNHFLELLLSLKKYEYLVNYKYFPQK